MSAGGSAASGGALRGRRFIVVDSSIMAGIFFEESPVLDALDALDAIGQSSADRLIAPDFLVLELANVVVSNRRRLGQRKSGRSSEGDSSRAADTASVKSGFYSVPSSMIAREIETRLASADITLDSVSSEPRCSRAIQIAEMHRLSVYDACYVALAVEFRATLATLDMDMRRAASDIGVPLLPTAVRAPRN